MVSIRFNPCAADVIAMTAAGSLLTARLGIWATIAHPATQSRSAGILGLVRAVQSGRFSTRWIAARDTSNSLASTPSEMPA